MLVSVIRSMRLSFLPLAIVCVFLGYAVTVVYIGQPPLLNLVLVFVGALCAHISANMLNEYADFRSGLDLHTEKTLFSGGSGALVDNPRAASAVLIMALGGLFATVAIGAYFLWHAGLGLLPLGFLGMIIILSYTPWLNKRPLLCLVAPGIAFGPLMVMGTVFALSGQYSVEAFGVSLVPFFLVNNLLLLNQIPDMDADVSAGRRHIPIVVGAKNSLYIYGVFWLAAHLCLLSLVRFGNFKTAIFTCFLPLSMGLVPFIGLLKCNCKVRVIEPFLGLNVLVVLITPLALALSLMATD